MIAALMGKNPLPKFALFTFPRIIKACRDGLEKELHCISSEILSVGARNPAKTSTG